MVAIHGSNHPVHERTSYEFTTPTVAHTRILSRTQQAKGRGRGERQGRELELELELGRLETGERAELHH